MTELSPTALGSNNYPLRGGKGTDFQGGVRTAAFVAGGLLPASVRGTVLHDPIHIADWYTTFRVLAGVMAPAGGVEDHPLAAVPPVDGLDMWPLLTGQNTTGVHVDGPLRWRLEVAP